MDIDPEAIPIVVVGCGSFNPLTFLHLRIFGSFLLSFFFILHSFFIFILFSSFFVLLRSSSFFSSYLLSNPDSMTFSFSFSPLLLSFPFSFLSFRNGQGLPFDARKQKVRSHWWVSFACLRRVPEKGTSLSQPSHWDVPEGPGKLRLAWSGCLGGTAASLDQNLSGFGERRGAPQ